MTPNYCVISYLNSVIDVAKDLLFLRVNIYLPRVQEDDQKRHVLFAKKITKANSKHVECWSLYELEGEKKFGRLLVRESRNEIVHITVKFFEKNQIFRMLDE